MLDFILLGAFAFLIWRVIQAIFTNLQQLFTRSPSTITNIDSNQQLIQKPKEQESLIKPINDKSQPKAQPQPSKQAKDSKPYKSEIVSSNLVQKIQVKQSTKQKEKTTIRNSPPRQMERSPSLEKQRYQVEQYRFSDLQQLRSENQRLRQKIERFQQQKTSYISKIEDIIQHIVHEQRLPVKSSFDNEQDGEIKALNLLKKELNHVQQSQAERFSIFQRELLEKKEKEIELIKESYNQQLSELNQRPRNSQTNERVGTDPQIEKLREDNEHKDHQIETLRVSLKETISLIESLKAKLEEKNIRGSMREEELHLELNGEQVNSQIIFLRKRVEELEESEANLKALAEDYQSTIKQNRLTQNAGDSSASEALLNATLQRTERALQLCQQELRKQIQKSSNAQKTLQDYRQRLQKEKEKSSIFENDKVQQQIDSIAKLQSLQKDKQSLQQQVHQLQEKIFAEEQRRNELISQGKAKISLQYEEQLDKLRNDFEAESYQRKQFEKKVLEVQNELEFVQTQLKHSTETEKALNQEISILKNSKKQEKNSATDVQTHPEYLKIKRKVVELEGQLKNSRLAVSQNQSEVRSKDEKVVQKVNYARTSDRQDRQVSPSFQSTTKDRTPAKIQLPSPSNTKEKPSQSTIFTGLLDRVSSPIDLRYKTPVEKPVIQSTIYQGGIVSEGYFGETNILNLLQRQYIIQEINHLKKISAKKTRQLYRSLSSKNKNISEYTSNVPNLLVVVELANKRILAAFTQAAFNKDINNQVTQKKYHSANKAMIIDVTSQRTITNSTPNETIRFDDRALIWGRNEFAVSSEQPLLLTCEINCESAVYPCKYSSFELLGSESTVVPISQFQVYRIFLG